MKKSLILFLLFLFPFVSAAAASAGGGAAYLRELQTLAKEKDLASHPQWLRLLQMRKTGLGRWRSAAKGKFFLSPRGYKDPQAELNATLAAFFDPPPEGPEEQAAPCRFPARYDWLKARLSFDPARLPAAPCVRLESWLSQMKGDSLSVVYASAYLNNPASMYGHTFLRINQAGRSDAQRLLDYAASYAADTPERNGVLFAAKGLFGFYPGRFTTTPYYFKVQQYNNMESRDLWEYALAFDRERTDRLLKHLWELGGAHFDYYFLNANCSYQLLPVLEAADPSLRLSSRFRFKTIPADTLRVLRDQPGLVGGVTLRPSVLREILARRKLLGPAELKAAEALARGRGDPDFAVLETLPRERQALVLDSAHDYFRYLHHFARFQPPAEDRYERALLARRGSLGIKSSGVAAPSLEPSAPPDAGHRSGRVGLGRGSRRGRAFEELSLRAAMHDLAEDPSGYVPDTQMEMFHLVLRYYHDPGKAAVEKLALMDLVSLAPLDRWAKYPSWRFAAGFDTARDLGLPPEKGLHFKLDGGTGPAFKTEILRREVFYAMGTMEAGAGGIFKESYRLGFGGAAGALIEPFRFWRTNVEGGWLRYPLGDVRSRTRAALTQSWALSKNAELRLRLLRDGFAKEALFTFHRYL